MDGWLESLKVGDEVAIRSGGWGQRDRIAKVTKVTATQIVCGSDRFRKSDGWAPGSGYSRPNINKPTQEIRDRVESESLRERIKRAADNSATTLPTLRNMAAAIDAKKVTP